MAKCYAFRVPSLSIFRPLLTLSVDAGEVPPSLPTLFPHFTAVELLQSCVSSFFAVKIRKEGDTISPSPVDTAGRCRAYQSQNIVGELPPKCSRPGFISARRGISYIRRTETMDNTANGAHYHCHAICPESIADFSATAAPQRSPMPFLPFLPCCAARSEIPARTHSALMWALERTKSALADIVIDFCVDIIELPLGARRSTL